MNQPADVRRLRPRATLYLRQSTYREESISLELQESAAREYAGRMGYDVVAVEADPGVSGRTFNRPAVQRVMRSIEAGETDVVVLWKWSRLSRSRLDWAVAIDKIESMGGRLESATEPADTTTSAGRFQRGVLAEVAAMESERIGEMWKETLQRRIRQGLPGTGGDRFGYVRVDKNTYALDPETAPVLAEAYRRYIEDEWGWARLTRWLNSEGHRTLTGAAWAPDKIRAVMDAGFAAGVLATGYRTGSLTYHSGTQPPIIDHETWQAYLARRAGSPRPARQVNAVTALSGLILCADCGARMRSRQRNGGPGYACGHYLRFGVGRLVTCSQKAALTHVREWVSSLATDVEAYAMAEAQRVERRAIAVNDAAAVKTKIRKLSDDLGLLTIRYNAGKVTDTAYQLAAARLEEDMASLNARERVSSTTARQEVDARKLAISLADSWDSMEPHELRTVLSKLLGAVLVIPPAIKKQGGGGRVTFRIVERWNLRDVL